MPYIEDRIKALEDRVDVLESVLGEIRRDGAGRRVRADFNRGDWLWIEEAVTVNSRGSPISANRCSIRVTSVEDNVIRGVMPLSSGAENKLLEIKASNKFRLATPKDMIKVRKHVDNCFDWPYATWRELEQKRKRPRKIRGEKK